MEKKSQEDNQVSGLDDNSDASHLHKPSDLGTVMITLNVGGVKYYTSRSTLLNFKDETNHMLSNMFDGRFLIKPDAKNNEFFIDRNGKYFCYILDFLRDGPLFCKNILPYLDETTILHLKQESTYYGLNEIMFEKFDDPIPWNGLKLNPGVKCSGEDEPNTTELAWVTDYCDLDEKTVISNPVPSAMVSSSRRLSFRIEVECNPDFFNRDYHEGKCGQLWFGLLKKSQPHPGPCPARSMIMASIDVTKLVQYKVDKFFEKQVFPVTFDCVIDFENCSFDVTYYDKNEEGQVQETEVISKVFDRCSNDVCLRFAAWIKSDINIAIKVAE